MLNRTTQGRGPQSFEDARAHAHLRLLKRPLLHVLLLWPSAIQDGSFEDPAHQENEGPSGC